MQIENIYFYNNNEGVLATFRKLDLSQPNLILTYAQLKAVYKNLKKDRKIKKQKSSVKIKNLKKLLIDLTEEERYELSHEMEKYINSKK